MRPTVCGWAAPGRPRPKKGLDRLRGEHLSCGDTVSIWEDPLLPFWLLLCAVGTIERQIPKGRLLREIGVRRTYRENHSLDFFTPDISPVNSSENYMCTVLYSDTDANHSYAVTDVLNNTQLWQLPQRFGFFCIFYAKWSRWSDELSYHTCSTFYALEKSTKWNHVQVLLIPFIVSAFSNTAWKRQYLAFDQMFVPFKGYIAKTSFLCMYIHSSSVFLWNIVQLTTLFIVDLFLCWCVVGFRGNGVT